LIILSGDGKIGIMVGTETSSGQPAIFLLGAGDN